MSFEIEGKLHKKFDTEQKTQTFQAREFVIETVDGNYTQYVKFQLTQDRCQLIDQYQEGDNIKVHFDLRGREWQGKYFTNLNAWRLEHGGGASAAGQEDFPEAFDGNIDEMAEQAPSNPMDDDLPF
jgi:hypothetical protein